MSSNVPADLKYTKSHERVRLAGDIATVGITDHAQHELTDIVFVELPQLNRQLKAGDSCAVVDNPALANSEPYAGGWFFKIKLSSPAEAGALLSPAQYTAQIDGA